MKIVMTESLEISREKLEQFAAEVRRRGHELVCFEKTLDAEVLLGEIRDAGAVICANMPIPSEVIRACPDLKFIDVAFTGVDHIGKAAGEQGIMIANASGYATRPVAELTLCMALSLLRHVPEMEKRCRDGLDRHGPEGLELCGKTVGIVGYGAIGHYSAKLFKAFGCRVAANSRSFRSGEQDGVEGMELEQLLQVSDIVVLHCPLTDQTRGLIGREALKAMKKTALLINMARGPVVDSAALADALNQGEIAGAGLDVFDREPPLDPSDPLLACRNVLVTPHTAFATRESMEMRANMVFDNMPRYLDGKRVERIVS